MWKGKNKYFNTKTKGVDSKLESKRKNELALLQQAGEIHSLEFQKPFLILKGFYTEQYLKYEYGNAQITNRGNVVQKKTQLSNSKHKVRDMTYESDFYYFDNKLSKWVIEDTKGFQTSDFKLKQKMMLNLIKDMPDHIFYCNDFGFSKKVK